MSFAEFLVVRERQFTRISSHSISIQKSQFWIQAFGIRRFHKLLLHQTLTDIASLSFDGNSQSRSLLNRESIDQSLARRKNSPNIYSVCPQDLYTSPSLTQISLHLVASHPASPRRISNVTTRFSQDLYTSSIPNLHSLTSWRLQHSSSFSPIPLVAPSSGPPSSPHTLPPPPESSLSPPRPQPVPPGP